MSEFRSMVSYSSSECTDDVESDRERRAIDALLSESLPGESLRILFSLMLRSLRMLLRLRDSGLSFVDPVRGRGILDREVRPSVLVFRK